MNRRTDPILKIKGWGLVTVLGGIWCFHADVFCEAGLYKESGNRYRMSWTLT
jgi:hypothetical protein